MEKERSREKQKKTISIFLLCAQVFCSGKIWCWRKTGPPELRNSDCNIFCVGFLSLPILRYFFFLLLLLLVFFQEFMMFDFRLSMSASVYPYIEHHRMWNFFSFHSICLVHWQCALVVFFIFFLNLLFFNYLHSYPVRPIRKRSAEIIKHE